MQVHSDVFCTRIKPVWVKTTTSALSTGHSEYGVHLRHVSGAEWEVEALVMCLCLCAFYVPHQSSTVTWYLALSGIMDFSLPRPFAPGSESSRCGTFAPEWRMERMLPPANRAWNGSVVNCN